MNIPIPYLLDSRGQNSNTVLAHILHQVFSTSCKFFYTNHYYTFSVLCPNLQQEYPQEPESDSFLH